MNSLMKDWVESEEWRSRVTKAKQKGWKSGNKFGFGSMETEVSPATR